MLGLGYVLGLCFRVRFSVIVYFRVRVRVRV